MTLQKLAEKMDTRIREYRTVANARLAWACELEGVSVGIHGFSVGVTGVGKTRAAARRDLAKNLRGKQIFHLSHPTCHHYGTCSTTLSIQVPRNLTA